MGYKLAPNSSYLSALSFLFHTVTPAHNPLNEHLCIKVYASLRVSTLLSTPELTRNNVLLGSSKGVRRQSTVNFHNVTGAGVLKHRGKGAELASSSEADVHLF